ncbi:phosphate signaling complex protein PhoU [Porticoccus sp.]
MKPTRPILDADEQALTHKLVEMYQYVSDALDRALQSLRSCDAGIAEEVVKGDSLINALQHRIEELGVQTIALQQPVASDLRRVLTDIYISMELERIADHAVAIAKIVLKLEAVPDGQYVQPIAGIAEICKAMLIGAKQAYDEADEQLARKVAAMDDEIDRAEQAVNDLLFREICGKSGQERTCTYLLWATHHLERIGDRITNIAERVVYMTTSVMPDLNR